MRKKISGFTLVEILVVIFIISIVTSVALLTIGRNDNKKIESFTNQLNQIMSLAEERAMLQPAVLGLVIEDNSFHFASLNSATVNKNNTWKSLDDKQLGAHEIPDDIELRLQVAGKKTSDQEDDEVKQGPQIIISTNGDITPFTLYIGKRGQEPRYAIKGDADGRLTRQSLS